MDINESLVDDTDHFDGTGMEIRRNKIMLEISGIEALKIASAHELLSILEKFQKLSHKARKLHP
jgi:hypothetical protein